MRVRIAGVVVLAVAIAGPVIAQRTVVPPAKSTYSLRGRILSASSRQPLTRAQVAVVSESTDADAVLTDNEGRFVVTLQSQRAVALRISKAGYAARRLRVPLEKAKAGTIGICTLDVGAAISGRVVNSGGAPAVGAGVTVRRVDRRDEDDLLTPWTAETDDLGEYRIGGLPPGRYTVAAGNDPESSEPSAIELKRGEYVSSVNLLVAAKTSSRADALHTIKYRGRATVQGRVVNDSGEPLGGATVQLRRPGSAVNQATADADGFFAIAGVSPGSFKLRGVLAGYVALEYGQQRSTETGRTLRIGDDEAIKGLTLTLPRGNAIVGDVVDEHGEPVEGATVRALQLRYAAGRTIAVSVPGVRMRRTDDRGQFRLFGLLPGTYLVSASLDTGISSPARTKGRGYAPVFYPATTDVAEAWRVSVELRRDTFDKHIVLSPSPAVRVTGFAFDSKGNPLTGMAILAARQRPSSVALEPRVVNIAGDGSFVFTNVPPGQYVVQALGDDDDNPEFVSRPTGVGDTDTLPIVLHTTTGATLEGRVMVEDRVGGHSDGMALMPFPVDFEWAPLIGRGETIAINPDDGRFKKSGLWGRRRFALNAVPSGWYLKSITINGQDTTDVPFNFWMGQHWYDARVVIGTNGAVVRGKVTDDQRTPVSDYTVVVFPTDRSKWFPHSRFLKFARPSQDDSFVVDGLPKAEYYVATVEVLDATPGAGEWQDPDVLEKLTSGAERVALGEGDSVDLTLKLTRR
jgi:hypothetical protein